MQLVKQRKETNVCPLSWSEHTKIEYKAVEITYKRENEKAFCAPADIDTKTKSDSNQAGGARNKNAPPQSRGGGFCLRWHIIAGKN